MHKHLMSKLFSTMLLVACSIAAIAQSIAPVRQPDGRIVFENAPEGQKPTSAEESPKHNPNETGLVYWSHKEHRWIPVPPAAPASMRAARSAANEVRRILAQRQRELALAKNMNTVTASSAPATTSITTKSSFPEVAVSRPPAAWSSSARPATSALAKKSQEAELGLGSPAVESAIEDAALRHNVDANLVRAIIQVESNFNPHAVSNKGALGLMQLMPNTARSLKVQNAFDPQQNVDAGVRHLKQLLDNYGGDIQLSLAAYNAGSSAVQHHKGVPPYAETQNYVKRITTLYAKQGSKPLLGHPGHPIHAQRDNAGHVLFTDLD